jgi:hypothetical protein
MTTPDFSVRNMKRNQITSVVALLACMSGAPPSYAQPNEPPTSALWCGGLADADASAKTEAHWRNRWLDVGRHWYSAFVIGPVPTNPFDLKAKTEPAQPAVAGFIWASGVTCHMTAGPQPDETVARVTASVIAFNEKSRWAPALRDVLLIHITFGGSGLGRRMVDNSPEASVISPELVQRVPILAELPKPSKQLKLPCKATQSWKLKRCVP